MGSITRKQPGSQYKIPIVSYFMSVASVLTVHLLVPEVVGSKLSVQTACCLAHGASLPSDSDGHFLLQPDKTYSFQFGFELPAAG